MTMNVGNVSFGCKSNVQNVSKEVKKAYGEYRTACQKVDLRELSSGIDKIMTWLIILPNKIIEAVKKALKK